MPNPVNVSAIIVTRGNVDLTPILDSLPPAWEPVIYDNGAGDVILNGRSVTTHDASGGPDFEGKRFAALPDVSVYGRYAAIEYASHDLIYVQDDDVIVSDPAAIIRAWEDARAKCAEEQFDPRFLWHASNEEISAIGRGEHVACNMPQEFRHEFYKKHALVGFGAVFRRETPKWAIERWYAGPKDEGANGEWGMIRNTCDIIVTGLTPRILVDVPKENLAYASDDDRMWRQPTHQAERAWMLRQTMLVKESL